VTCSSCLSSYSYKRKRIFCIGDLNKKNIYILLTSWDDDVDARVDFVRNISSTIKQLLIVSIYKINITISKLTTSRLRTPVTAIPKIDSRLVFDPSESILPDFVI
jgi:hypothetical protein